MTGALKLTVYFGESDRVAGGLLSDALLDLFEEHEAQAAVLMRAVEGFGIKQQLRTDRFLTLSDDLPLVAVAVDTRKRIEALLPHASRLLAGGLITLERARLVHDAPPTADQPEAEGEAAKLTLYLGRDERFGGRPTYLEAVDHLLRSGVAGATVLLGVDGMAHRRRRRARFFSRNVDVPLMVVSVGPAAAISGALRDLLPIVRKPIATIERVRVCKRDGRLLAEPRHVPQADEAGLGIWQKLTVYAGEQARYGGHPLYTQLLRRLREEHASGATALRGIWGFSGDHPPHGDRFGSVRRRVPVVTTVVDTPERIQDWFRIVDDLTGEAGLVTSELVPAFLAVAPQTRIGGLRLGRPPA